MRQFPLKLVYYLNYQYIVGFHIMKLYNCGCDKSNFHGEVSFVSIYKGNLANGMVMAIKAFNLQVEEAFKSFDLECEANGVFVTNLINIISNFTDIDFKALAKYMLNGSLKMLLYSHKCCKDIL